MDNTASTLMVSPPPSLPFTTILLLPEAHEEKERQTSRKGVSTMKSWVLQGSTVYISLHPCG